MDYIHIDKLLLRGMHGVYANERKSEQEFEVSLKLGVDLKVSGKSDTLADTVDYDEVKKKVRETVEGSSRYLIEKLADDIATKILEDVRIKSIEITIKKTAVWDNGVPGITITRTRSMGVDVK